jgi:hypothetical protein
MQPDALGEVSGHFRGSTSQRARRGGDQGPHAGVFGASLPTRAHGGRLVLGYGNYPCCKQPEANTMISAPAIAGA